MSSTQKAPACRHAPALLVRSTIVLTSGSAVQQICQAWSRTVAFIHMLLGHTASFIVMLAGMITGAKAAVGVQQCTPQGIMVLHLQAAAQQMSNLGRPTTA